MLENHQANTYQVRDLCLTHATNSLKILKKREKEREGNFKMT